MSLYNAKTHDVEQFIITKFDSVLNVEASYLTSHEACTCPAGVRPSCRHRQMLPNLRQRANTAWFWDFNAERWVDPTGEANKPAAGSEAEVDTEPHLDRALDFIMRHEEDQASSSVDEDQASHPMPKAAFRRRI